MACEHRHMLLRIEGHDLPGPPGIAVAVQHAFEAASPAALCAPASA